MNKQVLEQIVDGITEGKDVSELLSTAINHKTRETLGLINEDNNQVRIKGNDVFVGNNKVGSFAAEGDQIEFTDTEGNSKSFDNDEEMVGYIAGINEGVADSEKRKKERLEKVHNRPHDTDGKVGDYVKHELSKHKGGEPKSDEHGHDDPSGTKQATGSANEGELPPDKEKLPHSGSSESNDHGHDDPSGKEDIKKKEKSGSNPPDKEKDLKNKEHKAEVDSSPHGHDAPDATKEITAGK